MRLTYAFGVLMKLERLDNCPDGFGVFWSALCTLRSCKPLFFSF
jgi:hypothetical protein